MIKIINYFFQSIFIYLFFLLGRILGINLSRKLFSAIFVIAGPFFKSNKITENNLNVFLGKNSSINKKKQPTSNGNIGLSIVKILESADRSMKHNGKSININL